MKPVYINLLFIINYLSVSISASDIQEIIPSKTSTGHKDIITFIDVFEEGLKSETWNEEERSCYDQVLLILNNVRNATLWSTWVWDSMQLPNGVLYGSRYQLGNFDECMSPPWMYSHPEFRTQYCLADIQLTNSKPQKFVDDIDPYGSARSYINTMTKYEQELNVVTWGVCMPVTCKSQSISKLVKILYSKSHLEHIEHDPVITVEACQVSGPHKYSTAFYTFWFVMLSLIAVAVLSTFCANIIPSDSTVAPIANAFCMKRNLYDLTKETKDDIPALHGIRVLSATIVVLLHGTMFLFMSPIGNALDIDKTMELTPEIMHLDVVVDTFLLMSGLLHIKGLLTKRENLFVVLMKRYIRLIAPLALVMLYASIVARHGGSGPVWPRLLSDKLERDCIDNGWLGLLMVNNYLKTDKICYAVTWYVACDYQLTILGTVLFWIFCRDRRVGKVVVGALAVLAVILPGIVTYWNNLHALVVYNMYTNTNCIASEEFHSTYTNSLYRMAPYLIGLATGYVMTVYKPAHHRNTIPTMWSNIALLTSLIAASMVLLTAGMIITSRVYNPIYEAIYASTNRIVWTLSVNTCIIITEYGMPTSVWAYGMRLLEYPAWVPFSRLSYGLYMIHLHVVLRNLFTTRTPLRADMFASISNSLGVLVVGFALSLFMWLFVQAPFVNLINTVLFQRTKSVNVVQNGNGFMKLEKPMENANTKHEKSN